MTTENTKSTPGLKVSITRRDWLKRFASSVVIGAAGVGMYSWRFEPHWVEVVHQDLDISHLPNSLVEKTLVQISDIHIGDRVDDEFLLTWFARIADWKPDLVVFTGDFLTLRSDKSLPVEKLKRILAHFPRGELATIGILGNHDYGVNWHDVQAADEVERIAENSGIDVLRNETRNVTGLQFVGFDDYYSPRFGGATVMKDVNLEFPTLVLCHNPDAVDLPIWSDYRGWILSGHTHGGQCKPPFIAPPVLPVYNKRYSAGLISLEDGRSLYVNRALGHSTRVRFNVRPEITVFRLTRRTSTGVESNT